MAGILLAAYLALSAFCALAPDPLTGRIYSIIWIFGPPANLVYGTRWALPFAVGTLFVVVGYFAIVRARRRRSVCLWLLGIILVWSFFGVLAYAPEA